MAADIPMLWKLALASASFSLINILFFPHVFPDTYLSKLFFIFMGINASLYAIFRVAIYPYFLSPFRHLPEPKVSYPKRHRENKWRLMSD